MTNVTRVEPMETPSEAELAQLRFLRRLVTTLTAVMIGGLVLIVALIVIRFWGAAPALPDRIDLPDGARAVAFTQGPDWYAVVTDDNRILIYGRADGSLRQIVEVQTE